MKLILLQKNQDFGKLVESFADVAIANNLTTLEELLSASVDSMTMTNSSVQATESVEKLEISYFAVVEGETVYGYNHPGNQIATIVALNQKVDEVYAKDCAMQAAAMNPIALDSKDVPQDVINKEIEIAKELLIQEGKPENMLKKSLKVNCRNSLRKVRY